MFYTFKFQPVGITSSIRYAVKYSRLSLPSVNAGSYHYAYLINQACLKETAADMSTSDYGKPLNPELFSEYVHRTGQINTVPPCGNP